MALWRDCCQLAVKKLAMSVKENKNNDGASFLELKIPGRSRVDGAWNFLERFGYRYGDGSSRTLLASEAARGDNRYGVSKEGSSSSTKAWLEKMRTLFISKGSGFSSRSVITGDAFRPVNEVGIPSEIAQKMTFEERVNVHNIQFLQRLVDKNLCLTFRDGSSTYSLREGSKGHTFLRIGQVVHRRIMDGDIVFINRPPTTHKHSLQALRVYIHEDHIVKINPLMCGPLAADFDGDCVHLFYPQSLSARAEVLELFSVDKQLLSSHSGNLNLQLAIDALLSLKFIFKSYFLDKASAQQLAMRALCPLLSPAVCKAGSSGPRWSAQQVLQTALPPKFECHGERLLIRGSEVVKLDFNRDVIASVVSDILTSLFFSKSPKEALNFFDSLQPLLMENLFAEGFSVSLHDFFLPFSELEDMQSQIQDISPLLFQLRFSFNQLIQLQFESYMKLLNVPVANFILKSSALGGLIDSRSESAIDKIVQQIGFLGVQLSDKRKFYSRSLVEEVASLFKMKHPFASLYPSEEFGLVKICFFRGLDPYEGMVHSIATREVIVRSSKGLAEPGTLFKNLMAVLRDVVICYDGSVRNVSSNSVIQFEYGLGEVPVGVLAATAMSNPAYKAVLDSSPSSNSSWDMMKEILFCRANFRNDLNDRRVILYLNDCTCGRKYCQENASFVVKNHLQKVSLRDAAVEFLIEYKRPKDEPGSTEVESGLVGHVHLNATLLGESRISMQDILKKYEEQLNLLQKKKYGQFFKRLSLYVSGFCLFPNSASMYTGMPCLRFFWDDIAEPQLEKLLHLMVDVICRFLFDKVIKVDPRISTVNIVWIIPGTTSMVESPCSNRNGGVEITLEKTAVRQDCDACWIVLDCYLPVLHLIDARCSIPYAIKQIQDLLGISCGFGQAVQPLSTSVTSVTKGVLREHLILLASSITCCANSVGFNMSVIKPTCRSQVPTTEAMLYRPGKCFQRASEKCHVDFPSVIIASCSWGKCVAVGTRTEFDILCDTKETLPRESKITMQYFLMKCEEQNLLRKKYGQFIYRLSLYVSDFLLFPNLGSICTGMPCLKFFWVDIAELHSEKLSHLLVDVTCPFLFNTVIKGDPRISTFNIVWIIPGTTSTVESPSSNRKAELGVEVTLEKTAVRRDCDGRIVLDCYLPVFHSIDTRRSIRYAIKQIQDLFGSSCGFNQAVQHFSTSVTSVTKGVLKEYLILLASSMTCSGNLDGYNMSGIKAICCALSAHVPFTEATLYTPWKCSERFSEKCHLDSLSGIVVSCSWVKRVTVGTGTKFDILWDTREIEMDEKPIEILNFLHLLWSSNDEEMDIGCLGEQIEKFAWDHMEPAVSLDQEYNVVFADVVELVLNALDLGGDDSGWDTLPSSGTASAGDNGWANWGQKKEQADPEGSFKSGNGWGLKKDPLPPEDKSYSGGWHAPKSLDSEKDQKSSADLGSGSGEGNWWANRVLKNVPEYSPKPVGWVTSRTKDFGMQEGKSLSWDNAHSSGQETALWRLPVAASWKQNSPNGDANPLKNSDDWGSKKSASSSSQGWNTREKKQSWGSEKATVASADNDFEGSWESIRGERKIQSSWGQRDYSTGENALRSDKWPSPAEMNIEVGGSKSWELRKEVNSTQSKWGQYKDAEQRCAWNSKKLDKPRGLFDKCPSQAGKDTAVGGSISWESIKGENNTQSAWGQPCVATTKNNEQTDAWDSKKSDQPGASSSWGSGKGESGGSHKVLVEDNSPTLGKTEERKTQSSWGLPRESTRKSSPSADEWGPNKSVQLDSLVGWGSGKADLGCSDKAHEEDSSAAWGSKTGNTKSQSSLGQRSETTWKSSARADGLNQHGNSPAWGSGRFDKGEWCSGRSDNGGRSWALQIPRIGKVGRTSCLGNLDLVMTLLLWLFLLPGNGWICFQLMSNTLSGV